MPSRSYGQYCALARALDAVGDRWSLLVVRNLLLGPLRWSELRAGLPGVAKNLLSARLSELADVGIVAKEGDSYGLTARGAELEPVLFALADWGERHVFGPPREGEALRLRYLMTSVRRRLRPTRRRGWVQLHVDDESYSVRLGPDPTVVQGAEPTRHAVHTDLEGLRALLFQRVPAAELVKLGALGVRGDVTLVQSFVDALPPPP
ncbi:MAG: hypothetical protein CMN30_13490 [Sandaracinus sp.]|nr:hypothetical protein [Sandaracinus sp.]